MKGFHGNIETLTTGNSDFRRVLYTGGHLQLVLMTLPPGCDIGAEVSAGVMETFWLTPPATRSAVAKA